MKKSAYIAISAVILAVAVWFFRGFFVSEPIVVDFTSCAEAGYPIMESYPRQCRTPDGKNFVEQVQSDKSDLIVVDSPRPNDTVTNPLVVRGRARGTWFFEASFPIELVEDWSGEVVARGIAAAKSDWMTTEFVPFEAKLEFTSGDGAMTKTPMTLVLKKDNPSGLPEHDDSISIPIVVSLTQPPVSSGECVVAGCSGQICSDEDVVTTCEYKPEYACYKLAKCERQTNGRCGWTKAPELTQCLQNPPQLR